MNCVRYWRGLVNLAWCVGVGMALYDVQRVNRVCDHDTKVRWHFLMFGWFILLVQKLQMVAGWVALRAGLTNCCASGGLANAERR